LSQYLLAHDLGTSGNKASLFSIEGTLIKSFTVPYEVNFFSTNYAEQNPIDWFEAVCIATREVTKNISPDEVLAISFSGQMSACVLVDEHCTPLRPSLIWADQRAQKQADALKEKIGFDRMYELTGHRVSASYSLEKLMWIKENEPAHYKQTHKMLLAKDFVIGKLTGKFVTDYSDASGTNALDLKNRCWSEEILSAANIALDKLPELHESTDVIGNLTPEAAELLHLSTNTVVVCGGGDGPCSTVGAGCIDPGKLFLTFGTSAWIGATTNDVFLDKQKVLFCFAHVIPGQYMPCGTMQAAGSAYFYIKEALCQSEIALAKEQNISVYELLNAQIETSPVGAKGLLFLPYMLGERSPRWNPHTFGSFIGIKMKHQKEDYLRAVLEGVAMNLALIFDAYQESLTTKEMIFTGGGAKGDTLTQILSNVLQVSLIRPNHVENATSIAAALIAGIGVGVFQDFSEIKRFLSVKDCTTPNLEHSEQYRVQKQRFDKAYHCLEPMFTDTDL
jgi:xylulokinase